MYSEEELLLQLLDDDIRKEVTQKNEEDLYMQLLNEDDLTHNNDIITHHLERDNHEQKVESSYIEKHIITCPYCQSVNTKKISGTARFVSTGILGLASGKLGKQWHCNSCRSDF